MHTKSHQRLNTADSGWGVLSVSVLLIPPFSLIAWCFTIYAGIATPTEAAALGVMAVLVLAWWNGSLSVSMLRDAIEGTMRTTSMITLIILAAVFLNFVVSVIGLTRALADFVTGLGITPMRTMVVLVLVLLVVGCFKETLWMLLTTAPLIAPVVIALGFDPVCFGILLMVLLETALITPPIGINLYVVQGVRAHGGLTDVMIGAATFVLTMIGMIVLLLAFPGIALWLPSLFY